jgi:hypothetical protein
VCLVSAQNASAVTLPYQYHEGKKKVPLDRSQYLEMLDIEQKLIIALAVKKRAIKVLNNCMYTVQKNYFDKAVAAIKYSPNVKPGKVLKQSYRKFKYHAPVHELFCNKRKQHLGYSLFKNVFGLEFLGVWRLPSTANTVFLLD